VAVAPVTVALVDASGSEEWLELMRSALAAALEALPGTVLFGLVTFGTQVRASFPDIPNPTLPSLQTPHADTFDVQDTAGHRPLRAGQSWDADARGQSFLDQDSFSNAKPVWSSPRQPFRG